MTRIATMALATLVLTSAATVALAASKAATLHLKAVGALAYNKKTLRAPHGKVTIRMTSSSPLKHDVAIKGNGVNVKGKLVSSGGVSTVTATLKRGKYTFYCTVPGHVAAGMKGVLTVT